MGQVGFPFRVEFREIFISLFPTTTEIHAQKAINKYLTLAADGSNVIDRSNPINPEVLIMADEEKVSSIRLARIHMKPKLKKKNS